MWEGFDEFCRREGIEQGMVRRLFQQEPEALADLRLLETGEIEPAEFERRFGARLGVAETEGLIERMFAAVGPDEDVIAAVRSARDAGVRTGLISNSWGTSIYDPDALEGMFAFALWDARAETRRSTSLPPTDSEWLPRSACSSTTCARTFAAPRRSA